MSSLTPSLWGPHWRLPCAAPGTPAPGARRSPRGASASAERALVQWRAACKPRKQLTTRTPLSAAGRGHAARRRAIMHTAPHTPQPAAVVAAAVSEEPCHDTRSAVRSLLRKIMCRVYKASCVRKRVRTPRVAYLLRTTLVGRSFAVSQRKLRAQTPRKLWAQIRVSE